MEGVVVWRDSARAVRIWGFDARLALMTFAWLFWPNLWTTALLVFAFLAFRIAEARGYRLGAALRRVRAASCRGRRALYLDRYRRFADLHWL